MNRLEEIKERDKKYSASTIRYIQRDDLEYLINRVERYENALKEFTDKNFHGGSKANREDYVVIGSSADVYKLWEALKES